MKKSFVFVIMFVFCLATQVLAQEKSTGREAAPTFHAPGEAHHGDSLNDVAAKLANPNADLAKLTFKNQFTFYKGDLPDADDQWGYTLLFQPVFPFTLGETESGWNKKLFIRPAFPIVNAPVFDAADMDFDDKAGMGDIGYDVAFGLTSKDGWNLALGMAGTIPTGTKSDLTGGQWRLGPELLIAKGGKLKNGLGYFAGFFPSHQWDVGGWRDYAFSTTKLEPFGVLLPDKGWSIETDPVLVYDHEAESGQRWTIPINFKVSKTMQVGKLPVQFQLDFNYYVEQADAFGPDWMIGFNVTPVVPNFIEAMFKGK